LRTKEAKGRKGKTKDRRKDNPPVRKGGRMKEG
jgi:hypothetical protein